MTRPPPDPSASEQRVGRDTIGLQLLSLPAALVTDEPELARFCRDLFHRFLQPVARPTYELSILRRDSGGWEIRDPELQAEVEERDWLPGIVAARLQDATGNRVVDCDLYHAAALSRNGRGLVLCGESGYGKSTLTLGLLRRGWKFLSDEVAALHRERAELEPFPKALEVDPASARLLGIEVEDRPRRAGKGLYDPEDLFPGCLGGPCPLHAVVVLGDPRTTTGPSADELRILVHRRVDEAVADVAALDGFLDARWETGLHGYAELVIRCAPGFPAWSLDSVLGRHGSLVVGSSAEPRPPADFDREPGLRKLPPHQAVSLLLARYRGKRALAERLADHGGRFGELFLGLLDRLAAVRCYQLDVGRVEATLDTLEGILR